MNARLERPAFRELFLTADKRLEIYFYTSNLVKYLHARMVFERFGLYIRHFKSKGDPYSEDYSLGKERLLARAIEEIAKSVGGGSLFFVEDTSLRIDALSDETDFPGLAVKEWFAQTHFFDLDQDLRIKRQSRNAIIKSDIALHLPGLKHPVFFHGETFGRVADSEPSFNESAEYPWLTPNSFNGWFIPDGAENRLGEMSFDESWIYDFRVKAFVQLIDRLEEYVAALNLSSHTYSVRRSISGRLGSDQPTLFPVNNEIPVALIVIGRTCAGKTTFGEHARNKHSLKFIEASGIVRMFRDQFTPNLDAFSLATKLFEARGMDVVARKIIQLFEDDAGDGLAIIGFRTIEELEVIKQRIPQTKIVLIEASERTRFQRQLQRGRVKSVTTMGEFRAIDSQQWSFGLLKVAEDFADIRIVNEGSLEEYRRQVDAVITGEGIKNILGISTVVRPRHSGEKQQLYRCLKVLTDEGRPLTCDEIENMTSAHGKAIRHNNANKVLKRVPELAKRLEVEGMRVRYDILNAGRAYVRLMERQRI